MKSHSRPNIKTKLKSSISNQVQSRGINFYNDDANANTTINEAKPIKKAFNFRNIFDSSRDFFSVYNKGNYLSRVNKKVNEIKNTSLDGLYYSYLMTLPKGANNTDDTINNQLSNNTENISLFQTKSSLEFYEPKITTSALNEYYNQLSYYQSFNHNNISTKNKTQQIKYNQKQLKNNKKNLFICLNELTSEEYPTKTETLNSFIPYIQSKTSNKKLNKKNNANDALTPFNNSHLFELPSRSNYYHLPFSHKLQRNNLKKEVNTLLLAKNTNNYPANKKDLNNKPIITHQNKEMITKIIFINEYINKLPKHQFYSDKPRHRKMFVILDGTVAFNNTYIKGHFIEIPSLRYLSFLNTKKERMKLYNDFIAACMIAFKLRIPIKAVFLINGTFIDDLSLIPESEKAIYISKQLL